MPTLKHLTVSAVLAALLIGAPPVGAQPVDGAEPALDTEAVDEALDLYWARKREVKAIQKRLFLKDKRHEFSLFTGVIPNDEFFTYLPLGARWNFYFSEDFSVELWGSYIVKFDSDLKAFLESEAIAEDALVVNIPQNLQWLAGADVLWSPMHGKFAIFTKKLAHFDAHIAMGVGAIGTKVRELGAETSKIDVAGNVGLGLRFYINQMLSLRLDYRQYFFGAEGGGLSKPAEFTLGISFWTKAPE